MPKPRLTSSKQPPRRASLLEILILSAVSLAGFAGVAALVQAYSFRELHFAPRTAEPGTTVLVEWRFFGQRVWRRMLPGIVRVEEKDVISRGDYDPSHSHPAPNVDVLTVFVDRAGQRALTLRHTSLLREIGRMQTCLTMPPGESPGLTVRETERWWSSAPISNLIGLVAGLMLGLAIGLFFLIGAISGLWIRINSK